MKRKGMILVVMLWVSVILAVMCILITMAVFQGQAQLKNTRGEQDFEDAARQMLQKSRRILSEDQNSYDSLGESWAMVGQIESFDLRFLMKLFSVHGTGFGDESALINANTASSEILSGIGDFPRITADKFVELRDELASVQAENRDCPPVGLCGPICTPRQLGYLLKLSFEKTVQDPDAVGIQDMSAARREYLDNSWMLREGLGRRIIRIMSFLTVYSRQRNVDSSGQGRININNADAGELRNRLGDVLADSQISAIVESREAEPFGSTGQLLIRKLQATSPDGSPSDVSVTIEQFRSICDRITVTSAPILIGRINVNTAGEDVLSTIPGITKYDALGLVNYRNGLSLSQQEDLVNPAWVLRVISPGSFALASEYLTTRSSQFSLMGAVESGGGIIRADNKWIFAVFERDFGRVNPLLYFNWSQKTGLADN